MMREEKYITRNPLSGEAEERVDKRSDVGVSKPALQTKRSLYQYDAAGNGVCIGCKSIGR
jgi:hypothetical protein